MTRVFDRIMAGLEDAIAFVRGDTSKAIVHTPEDIMRHRKHMHRERAGLRVVAGRETKEDNSTK